MYDEEDRIIPYPLRMDHDLRKALEEQANLNDRPLSQEIISILKREVGKSSGLNEINKRLKVIEKTQFEILSNIKNPS